MVLQQSILYVGTFAPALVALWITARSGVPGSTQALLGKVVKWDVKIKWYLFAATYMALIKIFVAVIYKVICGQWPQFGEEEWYIMIAAILFSTWVQAGEEIGWRGFALPRLTARFGLPLSTLILGVIWACWHFPLFFVRGANQFGQSFPLYLMQIIALSVAIGWLYWRAQGSLLLPMLLHAAVNNTKDIVPSTVKGATNQFAWSNSFVAWITLILLWLFAIYFLYQMRYVKHVE